MKCFIDIRSATKMKERKKEQLGKNGKDDVYNVE